MATMVQKPKYVELRRKIVPGTLRKLSSELADQATEQSDQTQGVSLCFNHEHNRKTLNYQKQLNILTNVITLS